MDPANRVHFKRWLKRNISFRSHMTFIMFSTIFLGIVSNFIMFRFMELTNPIGRYPLIVLFSYGSFLLLIRYYIKNILFRSLTDEAVDLADFAGDCNNVADGLGSVGNSVSDSDSGFGFGDVGDADGEAVIGLVLAPGVSGLWHGKKDGEVLRSRVVSPHS